MLQMRSINGRIGVLRSAVLAAATCVAGAGAPAHAQIDFSNWHTQAQINAALDTLASAHSARARVFTIGTSHQGRPIRAIKISDGVATDDPNEGDVVFAGTHHAREWLTPEMCLYLAEHLLTQYGGSDSELTTCINNLEIWIIPIVNPDGYEYTRTNYRFWRKNRRNNGDGTFGVDLNRNYAYQWGNGSGIQGSTNPGDDTYQGTAPFSEPETVAFRNFVESLDHPRALLSYHTFSELFLRPWAYSGADPPGEDILKYIAQDTIARIAAVHGHTYGETIGYYAFGEATDYFWHGHRLAAFTPEMRPASGGLGGFDPPVAQIIPNNQENLPAAIQLIKDAGLRKLWIKDHAADTGAEPSAVWTGSSWSHAFWTSPDIWTDVAEPVEDSTVTLHVRVHNSSGTAMTNCRVQAWYTDPRVALEFPALSSVLIGNKTGLTLPPGDTVLDFPWTVPTGTNSWGERHWCVGAIAYHRDDRPLTTQIQKTSNIACRNFNTAQAPLVTQLLMVAVHNFLDIPVEYHLTVDRRKLPAGWRLAVPDRVRHVRPEHARMARLLDVDAKRVLAPGEELLQPIRITPPKNATPGTTVDLDVHAALVPLVPGARRPVGNGYSFRVIVPEDCPPPKDDDPDRDDGMVRIEVDDLVEIGLIEQRLDLTPVRCDGRVVYFRAGRNNAEALAKFGYEVATVDPAGVLRRYAKVNTKRPDPDAADIRKLGVRVVLEEKGALVVHGTLAQLDILRRLKYDLGDLREEEIRPRAIRVYMADSTGLAKIAPYLSDIFGPDPKKRRFAISGAAWDDSIRTIQEMGFEVERIPR